MISTPTPGRPAAAEHDVVIVGGRCAGASLAMLLARQGHDVVVVDRADLPCDTLSTHLISRGGVVLLQRWGLLDEVIVSGAPEIRRVSFHDSVNAPAVRTVKPSSGVDHLIAPRRHILDDIMLRAARDAGATVYPGTAVWRVEAARADGGAHSLHVRHRYGKERVVRARIVVGADGVHSRIARAFGARTVDQRGRGGATHYIYAAGLEADDVEYHVGDGGLVGACRTHADESVVFACIPGARALRGRAERVSSFLALLDDLAPDLAIRLRRATITAPVRGAAGLPNQVREAAGRGWALCGDAAYHRDPITGHGITDAFRDAHLLALHLGRAFRGETSEADALAAYRVEQRHALRRIFDITCGFAEYPARERLVELQRELSDALEEEAAWLASLRSTDADDIVAA